MHGSLRDMAEELVRTGGPLPEKETELIAAESYRAMMQQRQGLEMSPSINEFATALANAQRVMTGAVKDSTNPFFKSTYADLASVWDACRVPLTTNGIAVIQSPKADGARVSVDTVLMHTSGQWVRGTVSVSAKDDSPQAVGSAISYLRRYALQSFAGVAPEDDDAESAQGRGARRAPDSVKAPASPGPVSTPDMGSTRDTAEPPVGDRGSLPAGAVRIVRVDHTSTKNPNVTKHLLTTSAGETFSTIKNKLAAEAEEYRQSETPVYVTGSQTRWGLELVSLSLDRGVDEDPPF